MKNVTHERQYTGDFFATSNFEKKRQKAYLKGDKYFTYGKDETGKPQMFLTCKTDGRIDVAKTSISSATSRKFNNRKMTIGRIRLNNGKSWN